jgi:hypothetical protein
MNSWHIKHKVNKVIYTFDISSRLVVKLRFNLINILYLHYTFTSYLQFIISEIVQNIEFDLWSSFIDETVYFYRIK